MGAILKVEGLKKYYGKRCVVRDLSFEIGQGEIVSLLGPNGAGKTTSFYMTIGLIRPDAGKITFKGNDITKDELTKIAIHFDSNNNNANFKTIMRERLKSNGQNTTALNRYFQAKSRVEKMYYLNQIRLANKRGTKDDAKTKQIIKKQRQKLEEQYKKAKSGLLFNSEELELVE